MNPDNYDNEVENGPETEAVESRRSAASPEAHVVPTFDRALASGFIEKLKAEAQAETGGWWRDILRDEDLVIAPRGATLDVYWRGARLFHVSLLPKGTLSVSTHEKYLLDPTLKGQVLLRGGEFDVTKLRARGFLGPYREGLTLKAMKDAAGPYTDTEKSGCHEIAVRNSSVIDCEIAFSKNSGRADIAALEVDGQREVRLVFWEAKIFKNKELRASQGLPEVCEQITRYQKYLAVPEHQGRILESYTGVAENLVALHAMKENLLGPDAMKWKRKPLALMQEVAAGTRHLVIGEAPKVGLIIFNFDAAQRDDGAWAGGHLQVLRNHLGASNIIAVGDPKGVKLPNWE